MKDIIIVCEDAFGLYVQSIIETINCNGNLIGEGSAFNMIGYLAPEDLSHCYKGLKGVYLGKPENWRSKQSDCFAMGVMDPGRKKRYVNLLKQNGATFETLITPELYLPKEVTIPEGCIISAHSILPSAVIGRFVTLYHCMVGFDAVVEDFATVMGLANITTAHIGSGAYIGSNCAVMSQKSVGEDAVVLPNSIVVKNVKAGTTVFGNPAKRIDSVKK